MISTFPCWKTPTQEYVVPRSIPIAGPFDIFVEKEPEKERQKLPEKEFHSPPNLEIWQLHVTKNSHPWCPESLTEYPVISFLFSFFPIALLQFTWFSLCLERRKTNVRTIWVVKKNFNGTSLQKTRKAVNFSTTKTQSATNVLHELLWKAPTLIRLVNFVFLVFFSWIFYFYGQPLVYYVYPLFIRPNVALLTDVICFYWFLGIGSKLLSSGRTENPFSSPGPLSCPNPSSKGLLDTHNLKFFVRIYPLLC